MRWVHLRLHAPLAAFGGEAIDTRGVTRDFPARSMLTGLLSNALGWTRSMRARHQSLQDRIVYGALREHEPPLGRLTDYQTAQLRHQDKVWTTRGVPAGRAGGAGSYAGAHQRWRDYHADLRLSVVLRLEPEESEPTLDDLEAALRRPARPLFIGRKSCLPSAPILHGRVEAADARAALRAIVPAAGEPLRAFWPESEGADGAERIFDLTDERNWSSGLHGGARRVCEGRLSGAETDQ